MNEKLFNAVRTRMEKAYELVSFIALACCEHVLVEVTNTGVCITAFPRDEETRDKVLGLMRMYTGKDNQINVENHTGTYHDWFTCELIFDFEKD